MRKAIALLSSLVIVVFAGYGAFYFLKNECSIEFLETIKSHSQNDISSQSPEYAGSNIQDTIPQRQQSNPSRFELRVTQPNKIEGSYYAPEGSGSESNWSHKFVCDTKIGELGTAIFTLFLVIFTALLWRSTSDLWVASEREFVATHRPWVKLDSVTPISNLIFENGEGHINLMFQVSNKGNSPGLRVRVDAKIVASNQISLLDEQKRFASAFRVPPAPNELRPELTSWPGDTLHFPVRVYLSSVDMPRFKPLADQTPFPITLLSIVGSITYEFSFAPGYHQTGIIYDLRKQSPYPPGQFGQYEAVAGAVMLNDGFIVHQGDLARPLALNFVGTGPVD